MPPNPVSVKARALQCLAQREHSPGELRTKLLRWLKRGAALADARRAEPTPVAGPGPSPAWVEPPGLVDDATQVDAVLLWLVDSGYLSPTRFMESRVRARQARYGNLRIRQELKQHGLSLPAETQQALAQSELQRARAVWCKKYGAPAVDAVARAKQMRFLAGRGFSLDVVRRVVSAGAHFDDEFDS